MEKVVLSPLTFREELSPGNTSNHRTFVEFVLSLFITFPDSFCTLLIPLKKYKKKIFGGRKWKKKKDWFQNNGKLSSYSELLLKREREREIMRLLQELFDKHAVCPMHYDKSPRTGCCSSKHCLKSCFICLIMYLDLTSPLQQTKLNWVNLPQDMNTDLLTVC